MVKTLRFTPLPARVHVDPTANTARAEINMTFTTAGARAVRHRAEAEEEVLEAMADAMLDPSLHERGISTSLSGNIVRKQVLHRALAAAEQLGWKLTQ